ncbi:uncharacterized protein LOC117322827 isoform X2 [Pecten maximus]|uniref:uncharacterized protein LOC117322827 isoform X2 n=1 Tax=Pecten maximus TaxID=6579 RepID=UPI0014587095|nr:uncharacterized protein LOC117322827 isoform X2 [Pecten maximus]
MASPGPGKSVIHYSLSDGGSWGSFLQKKLSEPQYDIPTELHEMGSPWLETTKYDVNIILVSPDFLLTNSFEKFQTCSIRHSLAILLGTSNKEFHDAVSRGNPQSQLLKWICYSPQQTRDSVKGLLLTIINLYESLHGGDEVDDDESCVEDPLFKLVPEPCSDERRSSDEVDYDTLPPTRQVNALHSVVQLPYSEEDESRELFILLDRKADSNVMLNLDSGETIPTEEIEQAVYKARIPKNLIHDNSIGFLATCKDQDLGSIECQFDRQYQNEVKRENSEKSHDIEHSGSVSTNTGNLTVSNPSSPASRLDIIHDILERETDPVHLLCKALRISDTDHEQLDEYLSQKCRHLRITEYFDDLVMGDKPDNDSEWPTLLHFCADTNLLKSTNELLQVPCLLSACLRRNRNQETPRDIAKRNGFTDLAELLDKQNGIGHTNVSRSSDSGIMDSPEDCCFPVEHTGTSMRDKNGGNDTRDVDSGVSELQHSYVGRESDYMDMSTTRKSKTSKSVPDVSLSSSVSDLRPSGDYDSIARGLVSKSYQGPAISDPLPETFNPLPEGRKEGETTWFVESPPLYRFPVRRCSESDKDSIRLSRNSRKASGSFGRKKQSFSKTISNVFKIKRKNSLSSNPGTTIPEEANSDQNTKGERGGGFPCIPIVSYEDCEEEEVLVSPKPPQLVGKRAIQQNDTNTKQKTEEKSETNKRTFKKMKNPFKKKIDRRKSLRMSRVLKDNNVVVLALPSKNDLSV